MGSDVYFNQMRRNRKKNKKISWIIALFLAMIIVLMIRLFFFQTYLVPSTSMSSTLLPGDWVLVNKSIHGPRMPNTILFIPFTNRYELSSGKYFLSWPQLPYHRLNGISEIKRLDVIAFNYPLESQTPVDKKVVYVKRCIGIPGDKVMLKNGDLKVNDTLIELPQTQDAYRVRLKSRTQDKVFFNQYKIHEGRKLNNNSEYIVYITQSKANRMMTDKSLVSIVKDKTVYNTFSRDYFPQSTYFNWSADNFGPVRVPKKGDSVKLEIATIDLYSKIISVYERQNLSVQSNQILINNKICKYYTFQMDYYFLLDDNRYNSKDSRVWGFLPEDHLIGKVSHILFSIEPGKSIIKPRVERILRKI